MKKVVIFSIALLITCGVKSQVAKWLIPPYYDEIRMTDGEDLIITDSLGTRIIWTHQGQRLASTEDVITSFVEKIAVTTKEKNTVISGFYNSEGIFTRLPKLFVTYSMPYFSNGKLLVYDGNYYRFVNSKGKICDGRYVRAYPYANGYATCVTYENFQKEKDPYNMLLSKDNEQINFSFNGKEFDNNDIDFISSVNDENIGIVVAKHKLYYFNGEDRSLSPVFGTKSEKNIKNQSKLEENIQQSLSNESDSVTILNAKYGKKGKIQIKFDKLLMPISINLEDGAHIYKKKEIPKRTYPSPLVKNKIGILSGLLWDSLEIFPPQFDEVIECFDNKAFVRLSEKCGMLEIMKDENFRIAINKGNPIDFRHQKYETTIRLDMPTYIPSNSAKVLIDQNSGCEIDMPSAVRNDTEDGNYIQYKCVLNIPESLPDEYSESDDRNEIVYPTQVLYNGLKSPIIPFRVKAWHYKYFNVDVNDSETTYSQGTISFTFDIKAERNPGEAVYPIAVQIQTDSLESELDKISETRYKCKVLDLKEGNNDIVVQILEDGCPPTSFPFVVTYTKPVAKTKNQPAINEEVVIKKKTKKIQKTATPSTEDHLPLL